jgi:hypothetical protein
MTCIQEKLERLLVTESSCPSKRCVPFVFWIWIAHASALDEPLYEEEVVFCTKYDIQLQMRRSGKMPMNGASANL